MLPYERLVLFAHLREVIVETIVDVSEESEGDLWEESGAGVLPENHGMLQVGGGVSSQGGGTEIFAFSPEGQSFPAPE